MLHIFSMKIRSQEHNSAEIKYLVSFIYTHNTAQSFLDLAACHMTNTCTSLLILLLNDSSSSNNIRGSNLLGLHSKEKRIWKTWLNIHNLQEYHHRIKDLSVLVWKMKMFIHWLKFMNQFRNECLFSKLLDFSLSD